MHSVTIACTITTLITTYIYIASSKVQLSQQLHCSVSYRWGYRNNILDPLYFFSLLYCGLPYTAIYLLSPPNQKMHCKYFFAVNSKLCVVEFLENRVCRNTV